MDYMVIGDYWYVFLIIAIIFFIVIGFISEKSGLVNRVFSNNEKNKKQTSSSRNLNDLKNDVKSDAYEAEGSISDDNPQENSLDYLANVDLNIDVVDDSEEFKNDDAMLTSMETNDSDYNQQNDENAFSEYGQQNEENEINEYSNVLESSGDIYDIPFASNDESSLDEFGVNNTDGSLDEFDKNTSLELPDVNDFVNYDDEEDDDDVWKF